MGSIAGTGGSLFLRKGLVTAQVALSFLLLFGAGLFVRSLQNLKTTDTGVALENLVTFQLSPALSGYDNERAALFYQQLLERLRVGAGRQVGGAWPRCRSSAATSGTARCRSRATGRGRRGHAGVHERAVARLLRDDEDSDPRGPRLHAARTSRNEPTVAIVNRRFAEHFFKGTSAVGKRIGWGGGPKTKLDDRDHRRRGRLALRGPARRRPPAGVHSEVGQRQRGLLRAHARCRRRRRTTSMRNEVRQLDAAMPVYEMKTLEAQLDETLLTDRLIALLRPASACSRRCSRRSASTA